MSASLLHWLQVISLKDQMEPFCQEHVKSCNGRLQDELRPYTQGSQQQAVHRRVIFTDAPHQYNTVALREELLAAALMGSSTKWAEVHAVLEAHGYILTLDYAMKMVHLEVPASSQNTLSVSCRLCIMLLLPDTQINTFCTFHVLELCGKTCTSQAKSDTAVRTGMMRCTDVCMHRSLILVCA